MSPELRAIIAKIDGSYRGRPIPTHPTTARPGSPAKVAVMALRQSRGEGLWHPDDAPMDGPDVAGVIIARKVPGRKRLVLESVLPFPSAEPCEEVGA